MKVVHVITSMGFGGAQMMLSRYLHACDSFRETHSVISLMSGGPFSDELRHTGFRVEQLGLTQGVQSLHAVRDIRRKLAAEKPDVIFGWMYHGCLAALVGRSGLRNTALVWGIHHSLADIRLEKASTRMVLRAMASLSQRVDGISYCSSTSRAQHEAIGFARDRTRVIPNAVDAAVFRPDPAARMRVAELCGIQPGRRIIGTVGRSHPMKDHVAMVRAAAKLLDEGRDVHGLLMGAGQVGSPAEREAAALGISDRISCVENRSDVDALVPGFDVFLLSSAWGEAFPVAVAEAMAAGVPCVVTDVGDCAELVGSSGTVVAPRDVDAMAEALRGILDLEPAERQAAGLAGRARVSDRFSFETYIAAHRDFYSDALSHRRSRSPHPKTAAQRYTQAHGTETMERPESSK